MESFWTARRQLREQRKREREQALRVKALREDEARRASVHRDGEGAPRVREDVRDRREAAMKRLGRAQANSGSSRSSGGK